MLPAIKELAERKQWVTWQSEPDDKGEMTKVPYLATRKASSTKPGTWLKHGVACKYAKAFKRSGVGFVFSPDDPYVGIDLDDCIQGGQVLPWAQEIINKLNSYCEVSPSGNGVKLWVRGKKPGKGIKALHETGKIEIYGHARYFTVTEQHLPGTPETINEADLDWLYGFVATLQKEPETIEPSKHKVAGKKRSNNTDPYAAAALEACLTSMSTASEGERNDVLNATAYSIGRLIAADRLSESVYSELREAARQCGLSDGEIEKTMQSGKQAGLQAPNYAGMDDLRPIERSARKVNSETGEILEDDNEPGGEGDRPVVDVTHEDLAELTPQAKDALIKGDYGAHLFAMGDTVYLFDDGKLRPVNVQRMRYMLATAALWVKTGKKTRQTKYPPKEIVDAIMVVLPSSLPVIERIVSVPVVAPQGHFVKAPGYDQQSGYYYIPGIAVDIPENPTEQHVSEALDLINDMLVDFPFKSDADYANAIGLLLLPFVRGAISGATPLHLIEAAREGTGKGLLNDLFHIIWTGSPAPLSSLADNDEEVRKSLTSALEHMPLSITYDNVRWINSAQLEKAITAQHWNDRVIGTGRMCDVPVHTIWIATGNNVTISGDMPRRVVPIRLIADCEQPALRTTFKHSDILQWTYDHREKLIQACMTIIQYGLSSNISALTPQLGSFTKYCTTMGKILSSCGILGFLTNAIKKIDSDNDRINMWRAFFALWNEQFGTAWVKSSQVYENMKDTIDLPLKSDNERKAIQSLGYLLNSQVDAVYSIDGQQYRIEKSKDIHTKSNQYRMVLSGTSGTSGTYKDNTRMRGNETNTSRTCVSTHVEVLSEVPEVPEVPDSQPHLAIAPVDNGYAVVENVNGDWYHWFEDERIFATEQEARQSLNGYHRETR